MYPKNILIIYFIPTILILQLILVVNSFAIDVCAVFAEKSPNSTTINYFVFKGSFEDLMNKNYKGKECYDLNQRKTVIGCIKNCIGSCYDYVKETVGLKETPNIIFSSPGMRVAYDYYFQLIKDSNRKCITPVMYDKNKNKSEQILPCIGEKRLINSTQIENLNTKWEKILSYLNNNDENDKNDDINYFNLSIDERSHLLSKINAYAKDLKIDSSNDLSLKLKLKEQVMNLVLSADYDDLKSIKNKIQKYRNKTNKRNLLKKTKNSKHNHHNSQQKNSKQNRSYLEQFAGKLNYMQLTLRKNYSKLTDHYLDYDDNNDIQKLEDKIYESKCYYYDLKQVKNDSGELEDTLVEVTSKKFDIEVCKSTEKGNKSKNKDVLYYLHGLTSGASSWSDHHSLRMMRNFWRMKGIDQPTVLSVSVGKMSSFYEPGKLDCFVKSIPLLEKKLLIDNDKNPFKAEHRLAMGISLGGANLTIAMMEHPNLFDKVYIESAGLYDISPFASESQIDSHIKKIKAWKPIVKQLVLRIAKGKVQNEENFEKHNVFEMAKNTQIKFPETMLMVGAKDELGVTEEMKKIYKYLKRNKENKVELVIIDEFFGRVQFPYNFYTYLAAGMGGAGHTVNMPEKISKHFYK
ncbi:MAG: prolyl oligopeptidase family serine peptidase [Oligoflexia bacterium]|nr:prolyl oligopeptidase family serine peptidase [Oligoflexia bacterium]